MSHLLIERVYDADTALVSPVLVLLQWSFVGLYCLKWLVEHLLRLTRCLRRRSILGNSSTIPLPTIRSHGEGSGREIRLFDSWLGFWLQLSENVWSWNICHCRFRYLECSSVHLVRVWWVTLFESCWVDDDLSGLFVVHTSSM